MRLTNDKREGEPERERERKVRKREIERVRKRGAWEKGGGGSWHMCVWTAMSVFVRASPQSDCYGLGHVKPPSENTKEVRCK